MKTRSLLKKKPDRRRKAVCSVCGDSCSREALARPWIHSSPRMQSHHVAQPFAIQTSK